MPLQNPALGQSITSYLHLHIRLLSSTSIAFILVFRIKNYRFFSKIIMEKFMGDIRTQEKKKTSLPSDKTQI